MIIGKAETGSLATGTLGAILASTCCVGPLILLSLGIGGAWVSNLALLEPYRWVFLGVAIASLAFAWRKIFRPALVCRPGEVCAQPPARGVYKVAFWCVAALVLLAATFPYMAPLFY